MTPTNVSIGTSVRATAREQRVLGYVSLFASFSTLLCCALPSVLVLLGLGATAASALSAAPWLVVLSRRKQWMFAASGVLILLNFIYLYRMAPRLVATNRPCPPGEENSCVTVSRFSRVVLAVSAAIYAVGLFAAFLLGPILTALDQ